MSNISSELAVSFGSPHLFDQVRVRLHLSIVCLQTETAYIGQILHFINFHDKRHLKRMRHIVALLQNQAGSVLRILYRRGC